MNIGIDARISYYNSSGISRYIKGLFSEFSAIPTADRIIMFQARKQKYKLFPKSKFIHQRLLTPAHFPFENHTLRFELARHRLDLLHCPDFFSPVCKYIPSILTIHDLYFLKDPSTLDTTSRKHYDKLVNIIPYAKHLICDSESTKKDLLELTQANPSKVSVLYPGIDDHFRPCSSNRINEIRAKYKLPDNFLLTIGTIEPRKNLPRIIQAYSVLKLKLGKFCPQLLLIGGKGFKAEQVIEIIQNLKLNNDVHFLGSIPEDELIAFYSGASLLLYLSLYEGFGFPILEAMACQTPVLTSNNSSMLEIAAGAAELANPYDIEDIANKAERLLSDSAYANIYRDLGKERVNQFSWKNSAKQLHEIYRTAA